MNKTKEIILPIALTGLAFFGILIAPGSFLIHPTFDIKVESTSMLTNNTTFTVEKIQVTNTGWVQAKNVKIQIVPSPDNYEFKDCPEQAGVTSNRYEFQISTLERMSQNLSCIVVITRINSQMEKITVTADDSPGYIWKHEEQVTKTASAIFDEIRILLTLAASITLGYSAHRFFVRYVGR